MKKSIYLFLILSCLTISACTTSKGLAPVEKFFTQTNGSVYRESLDTNSDENASNLKKEFDINKEKIIELRGKSYSPFSILTGNNFEKDLIPVDEFLHDESGDHFAYKQWVEKEYKNKKIIGIQKTVRINELESIQDLVHKLATGENK